MSIFILCKRGRDHNEWYVLSAFSDHKPLSVAADALNRSEYESMHKAWLAGKGPEVEPPDDPMRADNLTFYVREVREWPDVEDAQ